MKTPVNIYSTVLGQLYDDGLVTYKDYKDIMDHIVAQRIEERAVEKDG